MNKIDDYIEDNVTGVLFDEEEELFNINMGCISGYLPEQDVIRVIDKIKNRAFKLGVEYANSLSEVKGK